MEETARQNRITPRRERFISHYLTNGGNATKAAAEAGFKHPRQQGSRLLTFVDIQDRIRQRVDDALGLTSLEVIGTLTSQMRADITELIDERGRLDLDAIKARGLGHLIKSLSIKRVSGPDGQETEITHLELHSSQAAAASGRRRLLPRFSSQQ